MNEKQTQEQLIKRDLTAAYRLIADQKLTDTIFTHITARSAKRDDQIYINRFGLFFDEVTPASLVLCSISGEVTEPGSRLEGLDNITNPNGFEFHAVVHKARSDANCVIHLHSHASTVVSVHPKGLIGLTQNAMRFNGQVAWYDYDGVNPNTSQLSDMVQLMGEKPILAMRHHGMLAVGRSVAEAFHRAFYFNKACQEQIDILSSVDEPLLPMGPSVDKSLSYFINPERVLGEREWPGWLRYLDRKFPNWAEN
jgi:ribulose-5-phosphate 4-epimerase/fuculose-1-phosphate aldolase